MADKLLQGKNCIVTGAARGIGKAVARELALEGVDVAIVARGQEALESTAEMIQDETGRKIIPLQADTGVDDSVKQMVEKAICGHRRSAREMRDYKSMGEIDRD